MEVARYRPAQSGGRLWAERREGNSRLTLQSNLVPLQALHCLLEQTFARSSLARDIVLLPLDGDLEALKDLLDRVGDLLSDTVTWNERNSVFACWSAVVSPKSNVTSGIDTYHRTWQGATRCQHHAFFNHARPVTHPLLVGQSSHCAGSLDAGRAGCTSPGEASDRLSERWGHHLDYFSGGDGEQEYGLYAIDRWL